MKYQVMPDLTPIEYEALKADIAEHGVLVPVEVDENGELLDGHHRVKAWQELKADGVKVADYARIKRVGWSEEQKRNHARRLNVLRRQLSKEQREIVMVDMRRDGATLQEVADAVGVSVGTVHAATENSFSELKNSTVKGKDGKEYPAKKPRKPKPPQQSIFVPGGAVSLDPKAVAETVKDAKQKKRDARKANQKAYLSIVHDRSAPIDGEVLIHNVDARYLADYAKNVHLVITSPPYNVGLEYDVYPDNLPNYWDTLEEIFRACFSVMVEGARICVVAPFGTGRKPWVPLATGILETLDRTGFVPRGQIIWDKETTGNITAWGSFRLPSAPSLRDTCECIIVAHKGHGVLAIPDEHVHRDTAGSYTTWLQNGDYFMELAQDHWRVAPESAQRIGHPAPFPTELVKRLIHFYGFPGCHVIDPFGGSGTVGVVAKELGCQATLFEISQDYCRLAKERIDA